MATATKRTKRTMIEKTTDKVLGLANTANDLAINATEKAFDTSFMVANKSLDLSSKVVKKVLNITETQQDLVFDVLNGVKKKVIRK